jgi:hypothetical protein
VFLIGCRRFTERLMVSFQAKMIQQGQAASLIHLKFGLVF